MKNNKLSTEALSMLAVQTSFLSVFLGKGLWQFSFNPNMLDLLAWNNYHLSLWSGAALTLALSYFVITVAQYFAEIPPSPFGKKAAYFTMMTVVALLLSVGASVAFFPGHMITWAHMGISAFYVLPATLLLPLYFSFFTSFLEFSGPPTPPHEIPEHTTSQKVLTLIIYSLNMVVIIALSTTCLTQLTDPTHQVVPLQSWHDFSAAFEYALLMSTLFVMGGLIMQSFAVRGIAPLDGSDKTNTSRFSGLIDELVRRFEDLAEPYMNADNIQRDRGSSAGNAEDDSPHRSPPQGQTTAGRLGVGGSGFGVAVDLLALPPASTVEQYDAFMYADSAQPQPAVGVNASPLQEQKTANGEAKPQDSTTNAASSTPSTPHALVSLAELLHGKTGTHADSTWLSDLASNLFSPTEPLNRG